MRGLLTWLFLLLYSLSATAGEHSGGSPDEALARLVEGNQRFVAGQTTRPHAGSEWRRELAAGQHPIATLLGCADSRVPPELIFDQGFGDLFVVRVAGNVVDRGITGSVDYAVLHLGTPLVVVMGHEKCGAVTAALDDDQGEPACIHELLKDILPATLGAREAPAERRVEMAVEENVRQSIRELRLLPELRAAEASGRVKVVGAVYELETGRVRFLETPRLD